MSKSITSARSFPRPRPNKRSLGFQERPLVSFPITEVTIDKRPLLLETLDTMPRYLLKPEVLTLLEAETHPMHRLILDLMWCTGARVSEVLAITPADGYDFGVVLKTLKQGAGRTRKRSLQRSPKRFIPILDRDFQTRIQSYLWLGKFRKDERIFPITRQAVSANIDRLIAQIGGEPPFKIGCHTFQHSFAVHLLLHGRPLKFLSQLLGHRSVESTEVYTNVLTFDGAHFLEGVDFH
ncbi:site-specific integrase [Marinobacter hydrocarbonoclasticus]|uniref:tyrosine-type recombinase/integrase n=1 Tax=Marinobacter nauticus TaxID=2743 RepID=UPI001A907F90|nr:site-specific integrase [Marinobacter nauticus]MBN8238262.1 site-specific integrase [Marinobacter nauticus]